MKICLLSPFLMKEVIYHNYIHLYQELYKQKYSDGANTTYVHNEIIRSAILTRLHDRAKLAAENANAREIDDVISVLISKFTEQKGDTSICFYLHSKRQGNN